MIGLVSEPETGEVLLTNEHRIVVLGSDGVWDQATNEEIIDILTIYYDKSDLEGACKELFSFLVSRW
jgi:serine/threonine protein phosphatase PrpC